MFTVVAHYRGWLITAHARKIENLDSVAPRYAATAVLEKLTSLFDERESCERSRSLRKIYQSRGPFDLPEPAKNAAVAAAKRAIDTLFD